MATMPFGKYKDTDIEDIPTAYLEWFVGNVNPPEQRGPVRLAFLDLMSEIEDELASREKYGYRPGLGGRT